MHTHGVSISFHMQVPIIHITTKDNIPVFIEGFLHARVTDPMKASYQAEQPYDQLIECVRTHLRIAIGKIDYHDLLIDQEELNKDTQVALNPIAKTYGINVTRFAIVDVVIPDRISRAHTAEMEAQHEKVARIVNSESRTLEMLEDAKVETEIEALTIAKRARATAEGMEVMGFKPGDTQSEGSSPISSAAQFLEEFSKPRTPPASFGSLAAPEPTNVGASEATESGTADDRAAPDGDHFQPHPIPHIEDDFQPQPLANAKQSHADDNFHPRPLSDTDDHHAQNHFNDHAQKDFTPQPLPGAEKPSDGGIEDRYRFVRCSLNAGMHP